MRFDQKTKKRINILPETVESSLKAFVITSNDLHLENKIFLDISVEATIQIFYVFGLFDNFDNKNEVFQDHLIFIERRRRYSHLYYCSCHFL